MKYLKQNLKPEQLKSYQYQIYAKGSEYLLEAIDESLQVYQDKFLSDQKAGLLLNENEEKTNSVNQLEGKLSLGEKAAKFDSSENKKALTPVSSIFKSLIVASNDNDSPHDEVHDLIKFDKHEGAHSIITLESGAWEKKSLVNTDVDILFLGDPTAESIKEAEVDLEGPYFDLLLRISSATKIPLKKFGFIQQINEGESKFSQANYFANFLSKVQPEFIVTLGAQAFQFMSNSKSRLSSVHGKKTSLTFAIEGGKEVEVSVLPTFHPEYILINPKIKKTVWEDLKVLINSSL